MKIISGNEDNFESLINEIQKIKEIKNGKDI